MQKLVLTMVALCAGASAQAATLTQTATADLSGLLAGVYDYSLSVDGFDPARGTLDAVGVQLAFTGLASGTTWDMAGMGVFGQAMTTWMVGLSNPDGSDLFTRSYDAQTDVFAPPFGFMPYANAVDVPGDATPLLSLAPSGFVAAGPVTLAGQVGMFTIEPGMNAGTDALHWAEVTATLRYDYTPAAQPAPVPLPAGLPLVLTGLGALAVLRRRGARG